MSKTYTITLTVGDGGISEDNLDRYLSEYGEVEYIDVEYRNE